MNKIGEKKTFWSLLKGSDAKNIIIPEIQRDYTYGSNTEHTNKVLRKMLGDIYNTLFVDGTPEMTMNFVYGYTEESVNYVPLDGQQRLTTLFLLHYYAALYSDNADFEALRKFTYATRETTKHYCIQLIKHHSDILNNRCNFSNIGDAIADMSWFIPSYDSDPSIRSMQFVMNEIEAKFSADKEQIWDKLTADDCPVNFYRLDFGPFGLSDDLYVKMNSRGKKLTSYEIFKSKFLKHVERELGEKELKRTLAIKFDNEWTDLVWETIGQPKEEKQLVEIDKAYIHLITMLFRLMKRLQNKLDLKNELNEDNISKLLSSTENVCFIEDFLDVFVWAQRKYNSIDNSVELLAQSLKQTVKIKNPFNTSLMQGDSKINNVDFLMLYGQYWALKNIKESTYDETRAQLNYRHLRNLAENSDDEIRRENMFELLSNVEDVMCGRLNADKDVKFNTNQWNEECEKESHLEEWKKLWKFEEHNLLRGSLSNFADKQDFKLSNPALVVNLIERLNKFMYIFDEKYAENDHLIRAAFLCEKDYTQIYRTYSDYRILGNIPACWRRMLVKSNFRNLQDKIMDVIDTYSISLTDIRKVLGDRIENYLSSTSTDKTDWRYYMVKYRKHTYKAYTHNDGYGYYYVPQNQSNTLASVVLQSSQFGSSNVAWYLLNLIIQERNENKYNISFAGTHAAHETEYLLILSAKDKQIDLSIDERGWYLKGLTKDEANTLGIKNITEVNEVQNDKEVSYLIIVPDDNNDYVEWCEQHILQPLEVLPNFKKL